MSMLLDLQELTLANQRYIRGVVEGLAIAQRLQPQTVSRDVEMNAEISALIDRLATSFARRFQSNAYDVDDLRSVAWLTVYRLRSERETEPSLSLLRSAIWRDFLDLARRESRRRTVALRDDEI